jgi:hypothetical protein
MAIAVSGGEYDDCKTDQRNVEEKMILRNRFRDFAPVVLLFVIVNALAISFRTRWTEWKVDQDLLIGGNLFLFAVTFFSF